MIAEEPLTLPAPRINPPPGPRTEWEREYQAFKRLLPQLLQTQRDQFVAIHDECVVDHDSDEFALIQRVHKRFGYVPIHVERVAEMAPPPSRLRHYREYRPESAT